jgi:hypothetical protein
LRKIPMSSGNIVLAAASAMQFNQFFPSQAPEAALLREARWLLFQPAKAAGHLSLAANIATEEYEHGLVRKSVVFNAYWSLFEPAKVDSQLELAEEIARKSFWWCRASGRGEMSSSIRSAYWQLFDAAKTSERLGLATTIAFQSREFFSDALSSEYLAAETAWRKLWLTIPSSVLSLCGTHVVLSDRNLSGSCR